MGKVKRHRQSFHLAKTTSSNDISTIRDVSTSLSNNNKLNTPVPELSMSENPFAGIDIPRAILTQTLKDFDNKSIISTKSSFKDQNLTKKQKRTLRHEAFVRKLDVIGTARKEMRNRKRHPKNRLPAPREPALTSEEPSLISLRHIECKGADKVVEKPKEKKCLLKVKQRQKLMMKDIRVFKKVLKNPSYKADPFGAISTLIQEKIRNELKNE